MKLGNTGPMHVLIHEQVQEIQRHYKQFNFSMEGA